MPTVPQVSFMMFCLAIPGHGQAPRGQCGAAPLVARGPSAVAAKPAKPRAGAPATLPQIRIPRPGQPSLSCWCGTVGAASLVANSTSQEVSMVSGLGGAFRLDHVLLREAVPFSSSIVNKLSAAAAVSGSAGSVILEMPLMSALGAEGFSYDSAPPVLSGTYDLVLSFTGSSPLGSGILSNVLSGAVTWEVCGYNVH